MVEHLPSMCETVGSILRTKGERSRDNGWQCLLEEGQEEKGAAIGPALG